MNIIILRNNLRDGLQTVERGISENTNLPILKNILLKTHGNKIQLSTTNLELGVTRMISGKINKEGGLTIPFHMLYGLVNNVNSEKINLETINNTIIFKTDNYEAKIQGLHEDEFPIIPKLDHVEKYLEFDCEVLRDALEHVVTAAHISEIRPEISGVLFDFQTTILKLVATDSFRLAEKILYNNQYRTNFDKGFKVIIPLKTIQEVIRIFPSNQPIKVFIDQNQILFQNNDIEMISRLIDGVYPDYEQIIPKTFESQLVVDRDHFIHALKLVSNFSGKVNDVRLKIQENQKILEVYASNQYLGENNYLIPSKLTGAVFQDVAFNWRYLLEGIKAVHSPQLIFSVNGAQKPALIKSQDDTSYFYILMPIRF